MDYFDNTWDGRGLGQGGTLWAEPPDPAAFGVELPPDVWVDYESVVDDISPPPGGVAVVGTGIGPGVRRAQVGPGVQTLVGLAVGVTTWLLTGRPLVGAVVGAGTGYLVGRAGRA